MGVVTMSATYGAGGSEIGPRVATALGLPFVDRAIPASVADQLGVSLGDAEANDEKLANGLWRAISSLARVPDMAGAGPTTYASVPDERAFREKTEQVLHEIAAGPGAVILGRAAAIVLAGVPDCLHVRLDGPEEARCRQHQRFSGQDAQSALRSVRDNDSARAAYVRHFYRRDPHDCRHYHLVLDSTAMPPETVIDLVVRAANARGIGWR